MSDIFGSVTSEQAAAGLSAIGCPTHHSNAVPVENLDGERVATLCPDCDRQLPANWKTAEERAEANAKRVEKMWSDHREAHHGHPEAFLFACRLCAEELNPQWRSA